MGATVETEQEPVSMTRPEPPPPPETDPLGISEAVGAMAQSSPLDQLRAKVTQARDQMVLDLAVPGLDDRIWLRFRPVEAEELAEIYQARRRLPAKQLGITVSADVVARACIGIFERDAEGELQPTGDFLPARDDGKPFTFATLILSTDDKSAGAQVRQLFIADGHVIATSEEVLQFSGYKGQAALEGVQGE